MNQYFQIIKIFNFISKFKYMILLKGNHIYPLNFTFQLIQRLFNFS